MQIIEAGTTDHFHQVVATHPRLLVDFHKDQCPGCRMLALSLQRVAGTAAGQGVVLLRAQLEVLGEPFFKALALRQTPTLMLFRDGILLFNQAGAMPPQALTGVIEQARELDMDAVRQEVAAAQEAAANGPQDEVGLDEFAAAHSQGAYVVDVRETDEVAGGRVPGAVHIPMNDVPTRVEELPTGVPVFVICQSGGRSRAVVDHLRAKGITAINVAGGTGGWAQRGWPLEA